MKKPFNHTASQTYASREEALEAHARQIDAFLRTPQKPGLHFTPSGEMRRNASKHAHDALKQKRVDIHKELEDIREQIAKRGAHEQTKVQAKAL